MEIYGTADGKELGYITFAVLTELLKELLQSGKVSRGELAGILDRAERLFGSDNSRSIDRARQLLRENLRPIIGE